MQKVDHMLYVLLHLRGAAHMHPQPVHVISLMAHKPCSDAPRLSTGVIEMTSIIKLHHHLMRLGQVKGC